MGICDGVNIEDSRAFGDETTAYVGRVFVVDLDLDEHNESLYKEDARKDLFIVSAPLSTAGEWDVPCIFQGLSRTDCASPVTLPIFWASPLLQNLPP